MRKSVSNFFKKHFTDVPLLIRYAISGLVGAIVSVVLFTILLEYFSIWYVLSATIAFVFALLVNFLLQKFWTFKGSPAGDPRKQLFLYSLVAISGLGLNIVILFVLYDMLDIHAMIAQIISVLVVSLVNFIVNKNYTFHYAPTTAHTNR